MSSSPRRIVNTLDGLSGRGLSPSWAGFADQALLDRAAAIRFVRAFEPEHVVRRDQGAQRHTRGLTLTRWNTLARGSPDIDAVRASQAGWPRAIIESGSASGRWP